MNIEQVRDFVPLPWRAVYSASKAYVRFFARALYEDRNSSEGLGCRIFFSIFAPKIENDNRMKKNIALSRLLVHMAGNLMGLISVAIM